MDNRNGNNSKGVDLSNWQGEVDFNKIEGAGYDVVILKASEGVGFTDPKFEGNYGKVSKTGLKIGMYHYMSEKTEPKEQANYFWNLIKNKSFHVYPILDIEADTVGRGAKGVTDRCLEFLNEFKKLSGYDCIIYTYTFFANSKLDTRLSGYKLWIAHYGVSTPGANKIWSNWVGFQYTDKEKVPGVVSPCDANEFKDDAFIDSRSNDTTVSPPIVSTGNKLWQNSISGEEVKSLQKELNRLGAKLVVDGYFGDNTLNACQNLKKGSKGTLVTLMQKRLINRGYSLAPYNADGSFGTITDTKVRSLQSKHGLVVDGIVGKNTWRALYSK